MENAQGFRGILEQIYYIFDVLIRYFVCCDIEMDLRV